MGVTGIDSSLDVEETLVTTEERYEDDRVKAPKAEVDARRRLEDKLEEIRLKKELREYDFD
jgi:hypothetical protein